MRDNTSPAHPYHQLPLHTTTAQSNSKARFTAAGPRFSTVPKTYQTRAEVLLTSLAVSLDIPKKAPRLMPKTFIAVLRNPPFHIKLLRIGVETAKNCRSIASKLTEMLQNK